MKCRVGVRARRVLEPNADITKVKLELQEVDLPVVEPGFVMVKMVSARPARGNLRGGLEEEVLQHILAGR
jgi:hypothetical protein